MRGVIRKSLGVCAGLLLLVPATALAGQASVVGGIPRYDASFGETNNVTVGELPGPTSTTKTIVFRDAVFIGTEQHRARPLRSRQPRRPDRAEHRAAAAVVRLVGRRRPRRGHAARDRSA